MSPQAVIWKDFPKSQDARRYGLRERGALPAIDRGDIHRQSTVAATSGLLHAGAGDGQFEHKADSLIAKFKEAGGTVREIDV